MRSKRVTTDYTHRIVSVFVLGLASRRDCSHHRQPPHRHSATTLLLLVSLKQYLTALAASKLHCVLLVISREIERDK